jgi:O-acetyl-ADP-ribose deacetylase (regulator of RNase III)
MTSTLRASHQQDGVLLEARHGDLCKEEVGAIVNAANELLCHAGGVARAIVEGAGCDGIVDRESAEWVEKHGKVLTGQMAALTSAGNLPCRFVIHVAGPIWSKPVEAHNEIEVRGEVITVEAESAILMAAECGAVKFSLYRLAAGFVPRQGDRVRACVSKPPRAPPGAKRGGAPAAYSARFVTGAKFEPPLNDEELLAGAVMAALRTADDAQCDSVSIPAISSGIFGFPLDLCAQILVKCGLDFAAAGPKHVKRIAYTNIDAPTVTAFVNEFARAFGPSAIAADAAAAAASKTLMNYKGRPLTGPLLITCDAAGNVIDKTACPPTTSAAVAKMKAEGFLFHASGQFRNNWVRGIAAPPETIVQTFDPRGDWGTSRYGVSKGVPGMEHPAACEIKGGKKKKKKKPKATGSKGAGMNSEEGEGEGEEEEEERDAHAPAQVLESPAQRSLESAAEVSKRIKAVQKKLKQARMNRKPCALQSARCTLHQKP